MTEVATPTDGEMTVVMVEPLTPPGKRSADKRFRIGVRFVLENGSHVDTVQSFQLLRDAKAEYDSLPKAPAWDTEAMFEGGVYRGFRAHIRIGGRY